MRRTLDDLIREKAVSHPSSAALMHKQDTYTYAELDEQISLFSQALAHSGLNKEERVATYLPKLPENVIAIMGTSRQGGTFVPINPLLKAPQVQYILKDCNVRILVTASDRLTLLADTLSDCHDLREVWLVDDKPVNKEYPHLTLKRVSTLLEATLESEPHPLQSGRTDMDMAAILYTSGSTGQPKGVVLSHRNMLVGAESVSSYLNNTEDDRILAVLPLSFDYGLSQLTTAFNVGACAILMDYLLPRDVIRAVARYGVTGLAGVPPLWTQLAALDWPEEARTLRYVTNTGGAMPVALTEQLRATLPNTQFFLMYGLTEAFRSTFLPPDQVSIRPSSMGKAIPNACVQVVREDGTLCEPNEPGELVHSGPLVSKGYWNAPEKTAERFKPKPGQHPELPITEMAVWSGDQVKYDEEGYLYFISRNDEMIKTSGYRVSPTEVESVIYGMDGIDEAVAIGAQHPELGQAIALLIVAPEKIDETLIKRYCQQHLPAFMHPRTVVQRESLPRNQNGKIDRKHLGDEYKMIFMEIEGE
jgi:acyl-CoA ligase (AMP-forming) (exosortase A-associated)